MTTETKIKIWRIATCIGLIPYVLLVCTSIYSAIFGITFFVSPATRLAAFFYSALLFVISFWQYVLLGSALLIISVIKIKKLKNKKEERP